MTIEIPNYSLDRKLSAGAFGSVYLATRHSDGLKVAIKILHVPNDANLQRFSREAQLLYQQAPNPHVVNILEWGFHGDPAYIVMELCAGGSLRQWVGRGMDWREICQAMSHVAAGLANIHKAGGFHRDIKPDNLLLVPLPNQKYVVKLGDFGLARYPHLSSGPMTRSPWGTPGYLAPELPAGVPYDQHCDVYSLGVTAIELLTGSIETPSLANRRDLPAHLALLLRKMTSQAPQHRPAIADCHSEFSRLCAELNPKSASKVAAAPQSKVAAPQPKAAAPQPKAAAPQPKVAAPQPKVAAPQPKVAAPQPKAAAPQGPSTSNTGGGFLGGLALLLGIGGVALATMNDRDADGRFRGKDGRFRSGRWG